MPDLTSQIQQLLQRLEQVHNRSLLAAQPDNRRTGPHHRQNRALERGRAQAYLDAIQLVHHYLANNLQVQSSLQREQESTSPQRRQDIPELLNFASVEQSSRSSPQRLALSVSKGPPS